jgi:hypothetical protein
MLMPRHCIICDHPERDKIDGFLLKGDSFRVIAGQFSLSSSSLQRHKGEHLNGTLAKAKEVQEVAHADNLLDQVRDLQKKALSILSKAEAAKDYRAATGAIREARGCLELLAKLLGELNEEQTINVLIAPEWLTLRTVILEALQPYPDARISVARALESLTNGSHSA